MLRLDVGLRVYLHRDAVDFRKNINGLALVEQALGMDPFASAFPGHFPLHVFRLRERDSHKTDGGSL